jgi:hypothetical protein
MNNELVDKRISRREFLKKASVYIIGVIFTIVALPNVLGTVVQFRNSDGTTYAPFTPAGGNSSQVLKKKSNNDYDYEWGEAVTETDPLSIHLNGDNSCNYEGTITRDTEGKITVFSRTGGLSFSPTRDSNGFITSITDGTKTWTFERDTSNKIIAWSIT